MSQSHDGLHTAGLPLSWLTAGSTVPSVRIGSRRWFLQAGLAGCGALAAAHGHSTALAEFAARRPTANRKAVILFWLSGGPSHLDMWDPKPDAPNEIRGPFSSIATRVPGISFCEHLPLQASIADKLSVIRSVDCSASNHTPITMQAGNPLARRTDNGRDGDGYPSMGSIVSRFRGSNDPELPAFVGLAPSWKADVWESGHMGLNDAPVNGLELAGKFSLPSGIQLDRLSNREELRQQFDRLRRDLDLTETLDRSTRYQRQAFEMTVSGKVEKAFNLSDEPANVRDAYGRESIGEKGLLARRLVEAGVTFVLVSGRWGYFDHHGDNVPPLGWYREGTETNPADGR